MLVASIDVGIINLAVAFVEVNDATFQLERVVRVENVDTTVWPHVVVPLEQCTLGHTKTATDRIMHFIQDRAQLFNACAHVLIERQPIQGHTDVEQVLYMQFRQKAELVSPNSMHKLLGINHLTYEWRKVKTVEFADDMLDRDTFHEYHAMERRHDVADALCLLVFWAYTRHNQAHSSSTRATQPSLPPLTPAAADAAPEQTRSGQDEAATVAPEEAPVNPFLKYTYKRTTLVGTAKKNN